MKTGNSTVKTRPPGFVVTHSNTVKTEGAILVYGRMVQKQIENHNATSDTKGDSVVILEGRLDPTCRPKVPVCTRYGIMVCSTVLRSVVRYYAPWYGMKECATKH